MHLGAGPAVPPRRRPDDLGAPRRGWLAPSVVARTSVAGVPFEAVSGKHVNVLVVDDQEAIRATLRTALDDEGFTVETAANGKEALDILERWQPCVILLDLMMPVMDGWAFREEQRRAGSTVPVVLLSAAGRLEEHERSLGAAAVIAKPFDIDRVISTIERVC